MFRKDAIENKKNAWRARAILIPRVPLWITMSLSLFFMVSLLAFVIFGTYTRRVNVTGEISTWPRAANVYSNIQGVVVKQFVTEGQVIGVGDPIYQIDVSKSTQKGVISENQRRDINNQIERIQQIINRLKTSKYSTLDMLEKQRSQYSEALKKSSDIIQRAQNGIDIMKKNMNNYEDYHKKGLINKDQLTNQVAIYYQQQNNLLSLSSLNEQNALQITSLESQIHTQSAEFDNQIYQMELQRFELEKELLTNDAESSIIIRALASGRVDSLSVTPGQMVSAGDSLLQIIPQNINHYHLILWVPNSSIPYLSPDDRVNIRYEAFPFERFGQFSGLISVISRSPASQQEMLTYRGAPNSVQADGVPYYKVIVTPYKQKVSYNTKSLNLENGMKAQVTLFLETRKIYQWMLTPFYDMKKSAGGTLSE